MNYSLYTKDKRGQKRNEPVPATKTRATCPGATKEERSLTAIVIIFSSRAGLLPLEGEREVRRGQGKERIDRQICETVVSRTRGREEEKEGGKEEGGRGEGLLTPCFPRV
jgi:hypothetical protein